MKSIVIITNNFPPVIDGVGDYSYNLYRYLKETSVGPVYVICRKKNEIENFIKENGLAKEVFPLVENWNITNFKKIIRQLKALKCEKVLLEYVPYSFSKKGIPFMMVTLLLLLKINRLKTGVYFHEVAIRLYRTSIPKSLLSLNQLLIAQSLCWLATYRMTSIRFNARQLLSGKISLIPVPSNFEATELNLNQDKNKTLLIACFANRINGFYTSLIESISEQFTCNIVLLGKVPEKNTVLNRLMQHSEITFTGSISTMEMIAWFQKTDIFLHLENVDGQGRGGASLKNGSLATAFAYGVPVISAKGDMTDELLTASKVILYPDNAGDLSGWIQLLNSLAGNEAFRKEQSIKVKQFYKNNLCWKTHSLQVLKAINEQ